MLPGFLKKHFHSLLLLLIIGLFTLLSHDTWKHYKPRSPYQFISDVNTYYSYLPALFIYRDLTFQFPNERSYWLVKLKNGNKVPRFTMGMSIMYLPFFLIGHAAAIMTEQETNGYSAPYSTAVMAGTLFYFFIGFFFLLKALSVFFKPSTVFITGLGVFFGTNLFYYTLSTGEMTHSYLFSLTSIMIWYIIKWHGSKQLKHLSIIAFIAGLCTLIRPTLIFFCLIPILYGISDRASFKEKIGHFRSNPLHIFIAALVFLLPVLPQLIYWKIMTGHFFLYSYGDEKFFFLKPHVLQFLFSYRKGWFVYTPLMLFAVIGMALLKKRLPQLWLATPLFSMIIVYVLSSWWCWWYGGSLGMRSMVHYYSLFSFPLAALIERCINKRWLGYCLTPLFLFMIYYNVLNTYKIKNWSLHYNAMTKESFWYTFMKVDLTDEEQRIFDSLCKEPNPEYTGKYGRQSG